MKHSKHYAVINRWVDGDTLEVNVDLDFGISIVQTIRIGMINCPESRSKDAVERMRGKAATAFAVRLWPPGTTVVLFNFEKGKYGRMVCQLSTGSTNIGNHLMESGHAKPYQ